MKLNLPSKMRSLVKEAGQFGLAASARTAGMTALYAILPPHCISKNKQAALLTFSINPDLARVWYYFAEKHVAAEKADIYIVDSSGGLSAKDVPNARVITYWNSEHGQKIDRFTHYLEYPWIWLCDDDIMISGALPLEKASQAAENEKVWCASFLPRTQTVKANGLEQRAMGSYCIIYNRQTYLQQGWSFRVVATQDQAINWGRGYYDTADYAHQQSLMDGYRVVLFEGMQELNAFMGTSIVYLKLKRWKSEGNKFLEDAIRISEDWRRISGLLGSAYCLCKVYDLYQGIFTEKPKWTPTINEDAILAVIDGLKSVQAKERAKEYIQRYQRVYERLAASAAER